mgnify:CR=1 FL=1
MRTIEEIKTDLKRKWGTRIPSELHSELIAAQDAEIARLREQMEWQSIETAPEQEEILGLAKNGHVYEITVDDENFYLSSFWPDDEWDCDFTHWMPIPPLPQPQEEKEDNHE